MTISDYQRKKEKLDEAIREFLEESGYVTGWVMMASIAEPDGKPTETLYSFHAAPGQATHVSRGLTELGTEFYGASDSRQVDYE